MFLSGSHDIVDNLGQLIVSLFEGMKCVVSINKSYFILTNHVALIVQVICRIITGDFSSFMSLCIKDSDITCAVMSPYTEFIILITSSYNDQFVWADWSNTRTVSVTEISCDNVDELPANLLTLNEFRSVQNFNRALYDVFILQVNCILIATNSVQILTLRTEAWALSTIG